MTLVDPHGRRINYLRLSVTDRCNLRCSYCMPPEGVPKLSHAALLSYEDLLRTARAAIAIGVEKIRVTGGEPLVRQGITGFLKDLARLPGLERLVLTTNGILLPEMAGQLRSAGVESLNISLDSLIPETFHSITRGGDLNRVLAGIKAAESAGFPFVKINVVVMRGVNDAEVAEFAAMTLDRPYRVRFIEYMPTLKEGNWQALTVPAAEILSRLASRYTIEPVATDSLAGPAAYYRIAGAAGKIGIIAPVSCHFCRDCNRIRVASTGIAKSCLFSEGVLDLKPILAGGDEAALREALRLVVNTKPARHRLSAAVPAHAPVAMSQVGG